MNGAIILLVNTVPLHKRPIYQGLFGAVFGLASVIGPLLGELNCLSTKQVRVTDNETQAVHSRLMSPGVGVSTLTYQLALSPSSALCFF